MFCLLIFLSYLFGFVVFCEDLELISTETEINRPKFVQIDLTAFSEDEIAQADWEIVIKYRFKSYDVYALHPNDVRRIAHKLRFNIP